MFFFFFFSSLRLANCLPIHLKFPAVDFNAHNSDPESDPEVEVVAGVDGPDPETVVPAAAAGIGLAPPALNRRGAAVSTPGRDHQFRMFR